MKIYVSEENGRLKKELKDKGYILVDNNTPCDAIICDLKNTGLTKILRSTTPEENGTLIIDSGSKSLEDIEDILINRSYGHLI